MLLRGPHTIPPTCHPRVLLVYMGTGGRRNQLLRDTAIQRFASKCHFYSFLKIAFIPTLFRNSMSAQCMFGFESIQVRPGLVTGMMQ